MTHARTAVALDSKAATTAGAVRPFHWLAAALITLATAILCLVFADGDEHMLTNADTMIPTAFIWDLLHRVDGWRTFQLPRVPSLFPDFFVYGILDVATGDFRRAILGYSIFQCGAFVWVGGLIVSRAARVPLIHAAAALLVVIDAVFLVDYIFHNPVWVHFNMFVMMVHFGPFMLSLVSILLVLSLLTAWRRSLALWLALSCFIAFLSDRIFMFDFVVPAAATVLVFVATGRIGWNRAIALGLTIGAGLALATVVDLSLDRAADVMIERPLAHALTFLREAPPFLAWATASASVSLALPYTIFIAYPFIAWFGPRSSLERRWEWPTTFVWTFAAAAILSVFALGVAIYEDLGSQRYFVAVAFWPLIFVAVAALAFGRGPAICATWGLLLALSVTLAMPIYPRAFVPRLLGWENALATCLLEKKAELGLRAGLSDYWRSRPAMISSNWTLQLDQITADGHPFYWNNDSTWYEHSLESQDRPPGYNFIVIDKLDPPALLRRFGNPARTAQCGTDTIWVYSAPLDDPLLDRRR